MRQILKPARPPAQGGAIFTRGDILLDNCVFEENGLLEITVGGAVNLAPDVDALATIRRTVFRGNKGSQGGAIFTQSPITLNISDSVFEGNAVYMIFGYDWCVCAPELWRSRLWSRPTSMWRASSVRPPVLACLLRPLSYNISHSFLPPPMAGAEASSSSAATSPSRTQPSLGTPPQGCADRQGYESVA